MDENNSVRLLALFLQGIGSRMSATDVKSFVYQVLCEDNSIILDAFPTSETELKRSGSVCGVMFCLHGPRAVQFTAIWEKDRNRILFYAADGKRYKEMVLGG
ncbi:hypothetical protein FACS189419_05370 [Planctomycetales bacterium]|nr:hypothetical protein FACS189419_05370 [Planctomycetales bacterium]